MVDLHKIQMLILKELLFHPNARFTELNIKGLSSDHFSYHISTLISNGYVIKNGQSYTLTSVGKEFANQMDTDEALIEKQPKVGILIVGLRTVGGVKQLLVQERTKEPYFGYQGFITGKVRYGEKLVETAKRELKEESGLDCTQYHLKKIVRNQVILEDNGKLVEDKIFYVMTAVEPTGELINTRGGKNYWVTESEFHALEKRYYDEEAVYKYSQGDSDVDFEEGVYIVSEF